MIFRLLSRSLSLYSTSLNALGVNLPAGFSSRLAGDNGSFDHVRDRRHVTGSGSSELATSGNQRRNVISLLRRDGHELSCAVLATQRVLAPDRTAHDTRSYTVSYGFHRRETWRRYKTHSDSTSKFRYHQLAVIYFVS